jgi:hypothetical protein
MGKQGTDHRSEEQSHEQHEKQGERRTQVHACRMPGTADSSAAPQGVSRPVA